MPTSSQPILLVLHNENLLLRQIAKMTSEIAEMITLRRGAQLNPMLDTGQQINAVIVGKSADGVSATDILSSVRAKRPQARTIILADPSDLSTSIEALHFGVVDHVLNPPLRERELLAILKLPSPRLITPASLSASVMPVARRPV